MLPLIVLSQFAGTSLWFTGNAILPELQRALGLNQYAVSSVTAAVMLGFVAGSLCFSFFSLADRFSPSKLFLVSSLAGAICNMAIAWWVKDAAGLIFSRFLTGFLIAGIYPVGMKIASDWYEKGLGKALGFLLGALVLGTAFPHLLYNRTFDLPWKTVLACTSALAAAGGLTMALLVGDGPFHRVSGGFRLTAIGEIFRSKPWRQAALGYFGHMWELYSFWGFLPLLIGFYAEKNGVTLNTHLLSFLVIATGAVGCVAGGYLSVRIGNATVAGTALLISGCCCLLSPWSFSLPPAIFIAFLLIWGFTVCPDSPQFSTLVARFAPEHLRGTALTIYNAIGFLITSISLFVFDYLFHKTGFPGPENSFAFLGLGALAGLPFVIRLICKK